jgi:hypothetical protein
MSLSNVSTVELGSYFVSNYDKPLDCIVWALTLGRNRLVQGSRGGHCRPYNATS